MSTGTDFDNPYSRRRTGDGQPAARSGAGDVLLSPACGFFAASTGTRRAATINRGATLPPRNGRRYCRVGDQAGSDAKVWIGSRRSFRPVMSIV